MITTVVAYLAKKLKDNKSVQDFFTDFTGGTVNWLRPLFLEDENQYKKIIDDLMKKPDSQIKRQSVESDIASHLEDVPSDEQHLKTMYEALKEKASTDSSISIVNSKNVVVNSTIKARGSVIIGDNNNNPNAPK